MTLSIAVLSVQMGNAGDRARVDSRFEQSSDTGGYWTEGQ